jgi:PAS domain S-box-containing protein
VLNRKVKLMFGSAAVILLVVGAVSYHSVVMSSESDRWVRHTHEVLENLQNLLSDMASIETSDRGFALTGDESYVESYGAGIGSAEKDEVAVRNLTVDNPKQQRQLPALEELMAQKIQLGDMVIRLRRAKGLEAAANFIASGPGQRVMNEYRGVVQRMQDEELRLLAIRDADAKQRLRQTKTVLIFGTVLGLLLAAAAGWRVRDSSGRELAQALRDSMESEAKYRGLLEAAPDAMMVVNQTGKIVLLNARAEKQFGYHRDELLAQKVKNIIPEGFAERLVADGARTPAEALAQQIGTGIELCGRRKDGSEFPIEIMLSPLESAEGILVTAAIRDITERKRAEAALLESEERYRMLLDGIQDYAIFMMDPLGQVVSWNAGAERIKGYKAAEIIGRSFSCFFPRDDIKRGRPQEVIRLTAANGRHEEQGMRVRKDGSRFLASVTITALRDPAGNLRGFSEFSHDLSENKESGAKYRGLLEAAPDAMVVVNQSGEIVLLNLQAEKQFGYHRDELVGQKVKNIIPEGFAERLIADELRSSEDALAQQIGTGIELTGRRKDGSEFPIEIMLSPLESAEGILVTAAIRDISVRRDAEKHLAQMESRYRGLLEAAPDAMVVVNQSGEIVLLNLQAEKQFGYHRDELVGQKLKNIIPEGFAERLIADGLRSVEDAVGQQIGTGIELIGRRKDGTEFPIEIMLSPLESAEGILVTAAIRDITKRKKSEEHLVNTVGELKRSNDELQQFAYVASHDLQEPLRMVASYTQLLAQRYKGRLDSDADEFIGYAVDGSNRMQGLIQDLLAYSHAGTNGKPLREISSENALNEGLANLRAAIEEAGAVVTHDSLPALTTDGTQLAQVFQNLVGNAIKYRSDKVPHVHVSAAKNGGHEWVFSVQDNGLGIDPQYFDRIFILFQRLHGQAEFKGTGIGLAICKKMLDRLGGKIWVKSQLEKGSTFYFSLPEGDGK